MGRVIRHSHTKRPRSRTCVCGHSARAHDLGCGSGWCEADDCRCIWFERRTRGNAWMQSSAANIAAGGRRMSDARRAMERKQLRDAGRLRGLR